MKEIRNTNVASVEAVLVLKDGTKKLVHLTWNAADVQQSYFLVLSEGLLSLSIADIQLHRGGNNNRLIFLNHPQLVDQVIYLESTKEVIQFFEAGPKHFVDRFKKTLHPIRLDHLLSWVFVVFFITSVFGLFIFRGPIFGGIGTLLPFHFEKAVGDRLFSTQLNDNQVKVNLQLKQLLAQIQIADQDQNQDKGIDWNKNFVFHISSDMTANAYASLGGHIFINKGLLQVLKTKEQLLAVVAHEMMHVKMRHISRSVFQALGLFTFMQVLVGDVSGVVAVLVDQGAPLLNLQYSRKLETEADHEAIRYLIASHIDPHGLPEALRLLMEENIKLKSQQPGAEVLNQLQKIEILNSHPEMEKRIQELEDLANRMWKGFNNTQKIKGDVAVKAKKTELSVLDNSYEELQKSVKEYY